MPFFDIAVLGANTGKFNPFVSGPRYDLFPGWDEHYFHVHCRMQVAQMALSRRAAGNHSDTEERVNGRQRKDRSISINQSEASKRFVLSLSAPVPDFILRPLTLCWPCLHLCPNLISYFYHPRRYDPKPTSPASTRAFFPSPSAALVCRSPNPVSCTSYCPSPMLSCLVTPAEIPSIVSPYSTTHHSPHHQPRC